MQCKHILLLLLLLLLLCYKHHRLLCSFLCSFQLTSAVIDKRRHICRGDITVM
jgi:hypothetical protein